MGSDFFVFVSDDRSRVSVHGEVDIATAARLDAALGGLPGDVEVDCSEVRFISTAGLYSLNRGYLSAEKRTAQFVVTGMTDFQRMLATMCGVRFLAEPMSPVAAN